ncbi:MAG: fatty acid desaturase [Alphaproteobacteria bacterium]|nr:fatty acid desaturase [Alphaproteobacteria bacterium]
MDAGTYKQSMTSIKQLRVSSYAMSYVIIGLNLLMFAVGIHLLLAESFFSYALGVALLALQMNHAYLIVHECGHGSFLLQKKYNEICGNIFAFFAILPFYARRYEHAMHHRYTGSFEEPSTERAMKRFNLINPAVVAFMSACWKLWVPIFALNEHVMLWKMPFERKMNGSAKLYTILALASYIVVIAAVLLFSSRGTHFLLAFLPVIYAYMMLIEFFNLPHHLTSPIDDHKGPRPYYEQSGFSRSCSPMPWPIGKFLVLNFNYHIAHHLYPAVHWTKLPEAHRIMTDYDAELGKTEHEWTLNCQMRGQPLRKALSKYFDHQLAQAT